MKDSKGERDDLPVSQPRKDAPFLWKNIIGWMALTLLWLAIANPSLTHPDDCGNIYIIIAKAALMFLSLAEKPGRSFTLNSFKKQYMSVQRQEHTNKLQPGWR